MSDPIQDIEIDLPLALAIWLAIKKVGPTLPSPITATAIFTALGCGAGSLGLEIGTFVDTLISQLHSSPTATPAPPPSTGAHS